MTSRRRHLFGLVFSLALLIGMAWLVRHALKGLDMEQVRTSILELEPGQVLEALASTSLAYLCLATYDRLALEHLRRPVARLRTLTSAFVAYAFSFNLGPLIGSIGMRLRLYRKWGLTRTDIAQVVVFSGITSWFGFCIVATVVLLAGAPPLPAGLDVPLATFRPLGWLALAVTLLYLGLSAYRPPPLRLRGFLLTVPPPGVVLRQAALASLQWCAAALTVYLLMPDTSPLSYLDVLGAHLLSGMAALISRVPGGLGTFEGSYVFLLGPIAPSETILAAVLAYRVLFYILPLLVAVLLFTTMEAGTLRKKGRRPSPAVP